ncbi:MAG: ATP-binding protein [Clostridiales bacterium]|jgi:DNA replication protein DnaC|nr:ATP-binding protein [Clostridiales bacterium]
MQNYRQIIDQKIATKRNKVLQARSLYDTLNEEYESFYTNECLLRRAIFDNDASAISKYMDNRRNILEHLNVDINILEPQVDCQLCNDEGYLDQSICTCVKSSLAKQFWQQHQYLATATFDNINDDFYGDITQPNNIVNRLQAFCERFPSTKYFSLVLSGNTGTGKTYLAGCIANQLLNAMHNVVFVSAMQFVRHMTKYHTTFDDTKETYFAPYIDCDLLIIDDLGTESIFNNITLEYLYLVIGTRLSSRKHILLTSNLDINALQSRYGMRIASRLYDKQLCYAHTLNGADKRIIGTTK